MIFVILYTYSSQYTVEHCIVERSHAQRIRAHLLQYRHATPTKRISPMLMHRLRSLGIAKLPKKTRRGCKSGALEYKNKLLSNFSLCTLNARSVRNKGLYIKDYIADTGLQITAVTETWLGKYDDDVKVSDILPPNYKCKHTPRMDREGGGVGIVYHESIDVTEVETVTYPSFEHAVYKVKLPRGTYTLMVVYRPFESTVLEFTKDFSTLLEIHLLEKLLIVGDFNVHVNIPEDKDATKLLSLLRQFGLHQHVNKPTHTSGNTLDLVITHGHDDYIRNVRPHSLISDHWSVCALIGDEKVSKSRPKTQTISLRKLRDLDYQKLGQDLAEAIPPNLFELDLDSASKSFSDTMLSVLDKHAPLKTKTVIHRDSDPWFDEDLVAAKKERRRLERIMRKDGSTDSRERYKRQRNLVISMAYTAKAKYYTSVIMESKNDQRRLFSVINKILQRTKANPLPPHSSSLELANIFANYYHEKIDKIHSGLADLVKSLNDEDMQETTPVMEVLEGDEDFYSFSSFRPVTDEEVMDIIKQSPTKTCILDSLPTKVLKEVLSFIVKPIVCLINRSLTEGAVPQDLKKAVVKPLLKKSSLPLIPKNYRPVSNLPFLSKILEKVVSSQLREHMNRNKLHEPLQSAYKKHHSVETALLRVQNDILRQMDNQRIVIQVLLDLSAAFDTVSHDLLLRRLQERVGLRGTALHWFRSYLEHRSQSVLIESSQSTAKCLSTGVPQGSVLGPELFCAYTLPLGDIIRQHGIDFHLYADDTQLYVSCLPTQSSVQECIARLTSCVSDIRIWMARNALKLNDNKTEFLVFGTAHQLEKVTIPPLVIGEVSVMPSLSARNLGVVQDTNMKLDDHIGAITKAGTFHLYNIRQIRSYLSDEVCQTLVHAFVTSRLDANNSLLYGLPESSLSQLQRIQNAAARVIRNVPKHSSISPVLHDLHWLRIRQRIMFKVLLLTYKCMNGLAPSYLCELLEAPRIHAYATRSKSSNRLAIPKTVRKTIGDRAFSYAAPTCWNALPDNIKSAPTLIVFKRNLKTMLFSELDP